VHGKAQKEELLAWEPKEPEAPARLPHDTLASFVVRCGTARAQEALARAPTDGEVTEAIAAVESHPWLQEPLQEQGYRE
jgi:hypothetical protein